MAFEMLPPESIVPFALRPAIHYMYLNIDVCENIYVFIKTHKKNKNCIEPTQLFAFSFCHYSSVTYFFSLLAHTHTHHTVQCSN